ncbi:Methyltransferase-like protein 27 [Nymphon striatum]|nr:Methyltransferase-like protein 27 [Nymphon striatum]
MSDKKPDLSAAYALNTPDDSVQLYADWADTYDSTFAEATGYRLPAAVAEHFVTLAGQGPVLDVGAGTGLVGAALSALGIGPVDATDISPDMLTVAKAKGHYRQLVVGNILKKLELSDGSYAGIHQRGHIYQRTCGP